METTRTFDLPFWREVELLEELRRYGDGACSPDALQGIAVAIVFIEVLMIAICQGGLFVAIVVCHIPSMFFVSAKEQMDSKRDETAGGGKILKHKPFQELKDTYIKAK